MSDLYDLLLFHSSSYLKQCWCSGMGKRHCLFLHVLKQLRSSKVNRGEFGLLVTMKLYKGTGSTAPHILNLQKDECSASRLGLFTPEKEPLCPFNRRLGGKCVDNSSLPNYELVIVPAVLQMFWNFVLLNDQAFFFSQNTDKCWLIWRTSLVTTGA